MKFKPVKAFKILFGIAAKESLFPPDFEAFHQRIINKVKPFTMTSNERLYGLIEAVKYITEHNIPGDIVECGVWKGGSMMAVAETLLQLGVKNRKLFLYDTFDGMTEPTENDVDFLNRTAEQQLQENIYQKHTNTVWAYSSLDEVQKNMSFIDYPIENINFIKGDILKTIPQNLPNDIALLRLDTDWYESTKHELIYLYPKLQNKGVLIIDDYGFWRGSKKAVDEYLKENNISVLLNRMDECGRIAINI